MQTELNMGKKVSEFQHKPIKIRIFLQWKKQAQEHKVIPKNLMTLDWTELFIQRMPGKKFRSKALAKQACGLEIISTAPT